MQSPPRMPMPTQPAEPGWWLAVDGRWYPPESAPAAPTASATPAPSPAPTPVAVGAVVTVGPALGSPGGRQIRSAPPLPAPNFQRPMAPMASPYPYAHGPAASGNTSDRSGEVAAIASLVLGIVALVCSWWIMMLLGVKLGMAVDLILGVTSLMLGISARHNGASGIAIAGITVGAVSCAFSMLWILNLVMAISRFGRI
jgi:hypothetical protein